MQDDSNKGLTREQLKMSRQRVSSLFNSLPLVMAIVDESGQIVGTNTALKKIFGYEQRELAEKDVSILLRSPPWTAGGWKGWLQANLDKTVQLEGLSKDGSIVPVDISIQTDVFGEGLHVVVIQDVSERVKLEKMKQEFFDMVSHDMRSPLSSIALAVDMLQDSELPEEALDQLKRVGNNSRHLIRLINDLLDIEKVEAGKIKLIYSVFSIAETAAEAIDVVQAQASKRKISLELQAPLSEFNVCADQDRILRVLINLLSNAIKFSPKAGRIIINIVDKADHFEVSVQDEGRGIPADMLDSIFERFTQVSASDATKKGGTGLGLAICKGFVEAHSGIIKVESEAGKGSRFYFQIPHLDPSLVAHSTDSDDAD